MSSQEPVEIYAARDEIDATLVNSMLAEAGIKSRVVGGQIAGAVGEVPAGLPSAPRVWAPADQADAARQLIREMEKKRRASWLHDHQSDDQTAQATDVSLGRQVVTVTPAALGVVPVALGGKKSDEPLAETDDLWECASCQETVTVDFEICWNCQTPREARDS